MYNTMYNKQKIIYSVVWYNLMYSDIYKSSAWLNYTIDLNANVNFFVNYFFHMKCEAYGSLNIFILKEANLNRR